MVSNQATLAATALPQATPAPGPQLRLPDLRPFLSLVFRALVVLGSVACIYIAYLVARRKAGELKPQLAGLLAARIAEEETDDANDLHWIEHQRRWRVAALRIFKLGDAIESFSTRRLWSALRDDNPGLSNRQLRAALAWHPDIARLSRQHNDANVLCLPARFLGIEQALEIIDVWLETTFEGGRHVRRVDKIMRTEREE